MKKLILLMGLIFVLTAAVVNVKTSSAAPDASSCLSFNVTFTARHWGNRGPIQVGCQGLNAGPCKGGIISIRPGVTKTLNRCACPFNAKGERKDWADGCLYVAKELKVTRDANRENRPGIGLKTPLPSNCSINAAKFTRISNGYYKTNENFCGKNKDQVDIPIRLTCPGPTATNTNTPTPTTVCPIPEKVTNIKIKCPNCEQATPTEGPSPTSAATATPTPISTTRPTGVGITIEPTNTINGGSL